MGGGVEEIIRRLNNMSTSYGSFLLGFWFGNDKRGGEGVARSKKSH